MDYKTFQSSEGYDMFLQFEKINAAVKIQSCIGDTKYSNLDQVTGSPDNLLS
jgi:hypothetical protein